MKVSIEESLLGKYSDKELVKYVSDTLDNALRLPITEDISTEAKLAARLTQIGALSPVLKAVSRRMNGNSQNTNMVV